MYSEYVTMFTHGFLYGYLKDIDNNHLKNLAIQNYKNRHSQNPNHTRSEDIIMPRDSEVIKIAQHMSDAYYKQFGKRLQINQENGYDSYWSQVHYQNESTQVHHHLGNDTELAAVYYVDIPENSGDLVLRYRRHDYDLSEWVFPPETGKFIIFNSGLEHSVSPNRNTEPRICISINFKTY